MNLNLLVALDALLSEQSVSRAAQKIFLTQAALSIVLKQLREIFSDELLVRDARTMTLTPFAVQLAPKVKQILTQIEGLAEVVEIFNPLTSNREFKLYVPEYIEYAVLSRLHEYLLQHAPKIKLNISSVVKYYDATIFNAETEELYLGPLEVKLVKAFQKKLLYSESFVLVGRKNNPIMANKITLPTYQRAKYVIGKEVAGLEVVDQHQAKAKKLCLPEEHITLISHLATALYLTKKTNLVTILPKRVAVNVTLGTNLIYQDLPFITRKFNVYQIWPKRLNNDLGLRWLRSVIENITKN